MLQDRASWLLRNRKRSWLFGGLGMFGFAGLALPVLNLTSTQRDPLLRACLGSLLIATIGVPMVFAASGDPAKTRAVRLLEERHPSSVVWLYQFTLRRQGSGVDINIGFNDGVIAAICVEPKDAEQTFCALREYAPHARSHFTEALLAEFHASPEPFPRESPQARP